jgi:Transcriptional regulator, AbiEi antitoxin
MAGARRFSKPMVRKGASGRSRDGEIARFAAAQHGVVTTAQLKEAGLTSAAVSKRVKAGRLHRLHRGVYAVGAPASGREAGWMAAVLACGPGAVLSHRSAAALWDLLRPIEGPIDVSVPSQNGRRRRPGIRIHRCASLRRGDITMRQLIPVTTPSRTVEDLQGIVSPQLHRRAIRQAEVQRFSLGPRIRGDRTRSDLERDFLLLCGRYGFPRPEVNVKLGRWEVDFLWRPAGGGRDRYLALPRRQRRLRGRSQARPRSPRPWPHRASLHRRSDPPRTRSSRRRPRNRTLGQRLTSASRPTTDGPRGHHKATLGGPAPTLGHPRLPSGGPGRGGASCTFCALRLGRQPSRSPSQKVRRNPCRDRRLGSPLRLRPARAPEPPRS